MTYPKRAIVQHGTHLAPPMPDEISGMGKTNGNASLLCKNSHSGHITMFQMKKKCMFLIKKKGMFQIRKQGMFQIKKKGMFQTRKQGMCQIKKKGMFQIKKQGMFQIKKAGHVS
jgi:hypothetical protein